MQLTTAPAELDGFLETEAGQVDFFVIHDLVDTDHNMVNVLTF
ncbi:hypothetical protein [Sphingobacterium siyangense]